MKKIVQNIMYVHTCLLIASAHISQIDIFEKFYSLHSQSIFVGGHFIPKTSLNCTFYNFKPIVTSRVFR